MIFVVDKKEITVIALVIRVIFIVKDKAKKVHFN